MNACIESDTRQSDQPKVWLISRFDKKYFPPSGKYLELAKNSGEIEVVEAGIL
jgi:hypothetical protein